MNHTFAQRPQILKAYHWDNRIILVFAENRKDALMIEQMDLLASDPDGLSERHLILFGVHSADGTDPEGIPITEQEIHELRNYYKVDDKDFQVILIGKDGGEKLRIEGEILTLPLLYGTIDAMPMRRREMRSKNE